jgi:hypothetical protein
MKQGHTNMEKNIEKPAEYKHGDKIEITIDGQTIKGHIEERLLGQWPEKRSALHRGRCRR